jgi:hypothetical protein
VLRTHKSKKITKLKTKKPGEVSKKQHMSEIANSERLAKKLKNA